MSARTRFVQLALSKIGSTVLWGANGPDVFDCSGLVLWALGAAGVNLSDRRAQDLHDESPNLATAPGEALPVPGDLVFYGLNPQRVTHVAIWLDGGRVVSADGATSRVTDLRAARANPGARVRLHEVPQYRRDFLSIHRNTFADAKDLICL